MKQLINWLLLNRGVAGCGMLYVPHGGKWVFWVRSWYRYGYNDLSLVHMRTAILKARVKVGPNSKELKLKEGFTYLHQPLK